LSRNCLLKHVIEGKIEGRTDWKTRKKRQQLLDKPEEKKGYRRLKKEAPGCTLWRTLLGRGYGTVVRQAIG
jgi:hypothetical protein